MANVPNGDLPRFTSIKCQDQSSTVNKKRLPILNSARTELKQIGAHLKDAIQQVVHLGLVGFFFRCCRGSASSCCKYCAECLPAAFLVAHRYTYPDFTTPG